MNKYLFIVIVFAFLAFITYIVDAVDDIGYYITDDSNITQTVDADDETSTINILTMLKTYVNVMVFQVEGIPTIITVLVFYPLSMAFAYLFVEILKDLIPFT